LGYYLGALGGLGGLGTTLIKSQHSVLAFKKYLLTRQKFCRGLKGNQFLTGFDARQLCIDYRKVASILLFLFAFAVYTIANINTNSNRSDNE
jgi:hypothetical protein